MMKLTAMTMLMMMMMMMKETTGKDPTHVTGFLMGVSVGPGGVWGVNSNHYIYYRQGTYGDDGTEGTDWTQVEGLLTQLDVGRNIVWGVNVNGHIYYRTGIDCFNPVGTSWMQVPGSLKHVTVNPDGYVWGVNSHDYIYFRHGVTKENPGGEGWKQIPGRLKQISAGGAGVWGVNSINDVYYRAGTFHVSDTEGTDWVQVPDMKMTYVSSAFNKVFGISEGEIFIREGMTEDNPTGTWWKPTSYFDLKTVDSMSNYIWSTMVDDSIWYCY